MRNSVFRSTEVKAFCQLSRRQAALYQQAVQELAEQLASADGIRRRGLVLAFLMRFKQICNHPSQWLGDGAWAEDDSGKWARLRELRRADWLEAAKLALVGNLLYYLCLSAAIQRAGGPLPTVIIGTLPVVVAISANLRAARRDGRLPWGRLAPSLALSSPPALRSSTKPKCSTCRRRTPPPRRRRHRRRHRPRGRRAAGPAGRLNYRNLGEVPEFAGRNTTTVFLARVIFDRMVAAIGRGDLGPGAGAMESLRVTLN